MTSTMNETLNALRRVIVQLRQQYAEARPNNHSRRSITRDKFELATLVHAQMLYLIPLYRALHAAVQQLPKGGGGVKKYTVKYEELYRNMLELHQRGEFGKLARLYGHGAADLQLLVPTVGLPFQEWNTISIAELRNQADLLCTAQRELATKKGIKARDARKLFLDSLTVKQRILLKSAIEASADARCGSVDFGQRDLESL
jgi:hypothetical protein